MANHYNTYSSVLYFILLVFSLCGCHTDYKVKIDNAILKGDDELAIRYLDKAIEEAPCLEFFYMRANCEMRIGKYENALRDYERLLQSHSIKAQDINSYLISVRIVQLMLIPYMKNNYLLIII